MTVQELNRDQLDELRQSLYYLFRYDNEQQDQFRECFTEREQAFLLHINTCFWEIPDEMVIKAYDGINFVPEDFWCSKEA